MVYADSLGVASSLRRTFYGHMLEVPPLGLWGKSVTGRERQTLRQAISEARRLRLLGDGLCGFCYETLPDDHKAGQRRYCSKTCRSRAQAERTGWDREKARARRRAYRLRQKAAA